MALRDELEHSRSGIKSKGDIWFETLDPELRDEFMDIILDPTVLNIQFAKLAQKYGCGLELSALTAWRKKQWASKTS